MNNIVLIVVGLCLLITSFTALAATPPDAGTILREFKEPPAVKLPDKKTADEPKPTSKVDDKGGIKIKVTGFDFEGLTLFSVDQLREELTDFIGQELTMAQLEVATQRIVAFYSKRGRIATAILPQQEVKDGRILIKIVEGKLGSITIDPKSQSRMRPDIALKYLMKENKSGENINKDGLESAVRLLKALPGVSASTTLLPGKERGTSDLVLQLGDTPFFSGTLEADNHGSISSGEYRGAASLNLNDPFGYGDQMSFRVQTSVENNYSRLAYNIPIGVTGARLSLSSSYLHYDLGGELKSKGDALTVSKSLSIPIFKSQAFNISGQLGYDFRWLYNEARKLPVNNKRINTANIGLSTDAPDTLMGGGFNTLFFGLGFGDVDPSAVLSDKEQDKAGPKRSGFFSKLTFNASRTQTIKENSTSLSFSVNGQYALKNLDSSEQFGVGGVYGVRAYASGEASGDTGFVASAELRQILHSTLQTALFYDYGWIKKNTQSWNGSDKLNEYTLDGVGMSFTWTPASWFMIKGVLANRIQSNSAADSKGKDSDGTKREPRVWVQTLINF